MFDVMNIPAYFYFWKMIPTSWFMKYRSYFSLMMAIRFLENENGQFRDDSKPFALVVSMNPPHMPYNQVPDRYIRMYDDKKKEIQQLINSPSVPDTSDAG